MSDLITRLRLIGDLGAEAADEIERLRREYDQLQNRTSDQYDEQQAHIVKLERVLEDMPCAYHDVRESDKGQCFCGDCAGPPCDCPKHEAIAAAEGDDE